MSKFVPGTHNQRFNASLALEALGFDVWTLHGNLLVRKSPKGCTAAATLKAVTAAGYTAAHPGALLAFEGWVIICFPA